MLYALALALGLGLFAPPKAQKPALPTITPPVSPLFPVPVPIAPPAPVKQRLGLSGALTAAQEKSAVRLSMNGLNLRGALPKLWAGMTVVTGAKSPDWAEHAARLVHAGATLVRFAPLSEPGVLSVSAKGEPRVRWELADAALARISQKGLSVVLVVDSPPPIAIQGWSDLVYSLAKRYADDARFHVLRWEFAGTSAQAKVFYAPFARSIRKVAASAPVGIHFTESIVPADLKAFATLNGTQKIPFDSVGWNLDTASPGLVAQFARLRAALTNKGSKTSVQLFPELTGDTESLSPTRAVALMFALFSAAPPNQPNGLLGVSLRGTPANVEATLTLLNRLNGLQIETSGNTPRVHGWTTRTPTSLRTLLLNEGEDGYALLTGKQWVNALPAGTKRIRMRATTPDSPDAPVVETDFTPIETEIPILLLAHSALMLEFRAVPETGVQCSLNTPKTAFHTGDELVLTANLTSTAPTAKADTLKLSGFPAGVVSENSPQKPLTLQPNVARALRYSLLSPIAAQSGYLGVTATFGNTKSGLLLKQEASFQARLLTPRVIVSGANGKGEATLRLTNAAPLSLPMTVLANNQETKFSLNPAKPGKPTTEMQIPVAAPSSEPGLYSVSLEMTCFGENAGRRTVQVAVPITAHYRLPQFPLSNFLAGNEWRVNDPFGAGRAEFAGGQKPWKSPGDLSFLGSALWDIDGLTLVFDVTDDVLVSPPGGDFTKGDSLHFTLVTEATQTSQSIPTRTLTADLAFDRQRGTLSRVKLGTAALVAPDVLTAILPRPNGLRYAVRVLWKTLGITKPDIGTLLRIGVRVNDVDIPGGASGTLSLNRTGALFSLRLEK